MADSLCKLELPDLQRRLKELDRLSEAQIDELARTAYHEVELIIGEAKEITPVKWGNLRASGHVQKPKREAAIVSVAFGFGGPAGSGNQGQTNDRHVGYAVQVHENLAAHHKVGEAKYLEKPVNAHQGDLDAKLVRALDTATRKTIKP